MPSKRRNQNDYEGPPPMKNCKPVKRVPNASDQFWEFHQAEYEAREQSDTHSTDRHNSAYPQLRDELDKRHSLTKVIAVQTVDKMDKAFNVCLYKNRRKIKKRNIKSRRIAKRPAQKKCTYRNKGSVNEYIDKHCRRCQYRQRSGRRDDGGSRRNCEIKVASASSRQRGTARMPFEKWSRTSSPIAAALDNDSERASKIDSNASGSRNFKSVTMTTKTTIPSRRSSSLGLENEPMMP